MIGLTLAVDEDFKVLFIVLVFHRKSSSIHPSYLPWLNVNCISETFEGLGIGSRLAFMELPKKYSYAPIVGAIIYGLTTPIGKSLHAYHVGVSDSQATQVSLLDWVFVRRITPEAQPPALSRVFSTHSARVS